MKEETDYVIPCLRRYGNTIITLRDLKKIGGEEVFLKILKAKGLDCELKEPMSNREYYHKGTRVFAHKVVVLKGKKHEK